MRQVAPRTTALSHLGPVPWHQNPSQPLLSQVARHPAALPSVTRAHTRCLHPTAAQRKDADLKALAGLRAAEVTTLWLYQYPGDACGVFSLQCGRNTSYGLLVH